MQYLNSQLSCRNMMGFKMAACWTVENLIIELRLLIIHNYTKYFDRRPNYGPKSKFKMAAVRHLGLSKIGFLTNGSRSAVDFPSGYQIWCKNVDRRLNYNQKSKFKMAAVRHLGILISSHRTTDEVISLGYISLSNFVLIRPIVLKIW